MQNFAELVYRLSSTKENTQKVYAISEYLGRASDRDKVWAIALLSGRCPSKSVTYQLLGLYVMEATGLPKWIFEECYSVAGDYSETIALLATDLPRISGPDRTLNEYVELILGLKGDDDLAKKSKILAAWSEMQNSCRIVFNKLLTGGLRKTISQKILLTSLATHTGLDEITISIRLSRQWNPSNVAFSELILSESNEDSLGRPYPIAHGKEINSPVENLGDIREWQVEYLWDSMRGQIVVRGGHYCIWNDDKELLTSKFPEYSFLPDKIPSGTVLDVQILAWKDNTPMSQTELLRRINRKTISKKLQNETPVRMILTDVLEWLGEDVRSKPQSERRTILDSIAQDINGPDNLIVSTLIERPDWNALQTVYSKARSSGRVGLILKRKGAKYRGGAEEGDWWIWKVEPITIRAVLLYAELAQDRAAHLYGNFTFAVKDKETYVTIAKTRIGIKEKEFEEIARWIGENTIERFGPVVSVPPVHVFELQIQDVIYSSRHKSGLVVQDPSISGWLRNEPPNSIDTLSTLKSWI